MPTASCSTPIAPSIGCRSARSRRDRVARFFDAAGVKERAARNNPNKGVPGDKAKERAEERAAKAAEAAEAAAAPKQEEAAAEEETVEVMAEALEEATPDVAAEEAAGR